MESSIFPKTSAWDIENSPHDTSPQTESVPIHFPQKKKVKIPNHKLGLLKMLGKRDTILSQMVVYHGWYKEKITSNKSKRIATKLIRLFRVSRLLYFELQQSDVQSQWQITCLCPFIGKFPQLIAASEEMRWKIYLRWWDSFGVCSGCILGGEYILAKTNGWLSKFGSSPFPGVDFLPVQNIVVFFSEL